MSILEGCPRGVSFLQSFPIRTALRLTQQIVMQDRPSKRVKSMC